MQIAAPHLFSISHTIRVLRSHDPSFVPAPRTPVRRSDNADGFYDVQQPDIQPKWNNRGRFVTGADGTYNFVGIKPVSYPIPDDGPVGQMLGMLGRHPYRPGHMHYIVTAPGFQKVVTHTFVEGDQYLVSDCVFGVKRTLVAKYQRDEAGEDGVQWKSGFDFIMTPQ